MRPWFTSNMIFGLSPMGRKQAKDLKVLHNFTERVSKNFV